MNMDCCFGHLFGFLLTHRSTQEIRAAKRVACKLLGDLHHLFLVHDDAVRRRKHIIHQRMKSSDSLTTVLALDEVVNHSRAQRARTIQRDSRNDILKTIGFEPSQHLLHAGGLQLKNASRLATRYQLIGIAIIEFNLVESQWLLFPIGPRVYQTLRDVDYRKRL